MIDGNTTSNVTIITPEGDSWAYDMDLLDPGVYDEVVEKGLTVPVNTEEDGVYFTQVIVEQTVIIQPGDIVDNMGRVLIGAYQLPGETFFRYPDGTIIPSSVGAMFYTGPEMPGTGITTTLIPTVVGMKVDTTINSGDILDHEGCRITGAYIQGGKFYFSSGMLIPPSFMPILYIGPPKPGCTNTAYGKPVTPPGPPEVEPATAPPTANITVQPEQVVIGNPARVTWRTSQSAATFVTFPDISYVAAQGQEDFTTNTPGTYTFRIRATNDLGSAVDTATLKVLPTGVIPPEILLTADNEMPGLDDNVRVTWIVRNASTVKVVQESEGSDPEDVSTALTGSVVLTRREPGTIRITVTATNDGGPLSKDILITFASGRRVVYASGSVRVMTTPSTSRIKFAEGFTRHMQLPEGGRIVYAQGMTRAAAVKRQVYAQGMTQLQPGAGGRIVFARGRNPLLNTVFNRVVYADGDMPLLNAGGARMIYARGMNRPMLTDSNGRIAYAAGTTALLNTETNRIVFGAGYLPPLNVGGRRLVYALGSMSEQSAVTSTVDDLFPISDDPDAVDERNYLLLAHMNGQIVDLTPDMHDASWRWGSRPKTEIGHVADPFSGHVTLKNTHGKYNPINPPAPIDPDPGVEVWLYRRNPDGGSPILLFSAWSRGFTTTEVVGFPETITIPLEGALARIATRNSELFARVDDNLYTGQIMARFLDNVGWKGGRDIDRGNVLLNWRHVNAEGFAVGGSRQFQDTLAAFNLLAQAETGRVYDDNKRNIIFDDSQYRESPRLRYTIRRGPTTGGVSYQRADYLDSTDSIINFIEPQSGELQLTAIDDWDVWSNFSSRASLADRTVNLLGGSTFVLRLLLRQDNNFQAVAISELGPFTADVDYLAVGNSGQSLTHGVEYQVEAHNLGTAVEITIYNRTPDEIQFILNNVNVRLLQNPLAIGRQAIESMRNDASIAKYGRKHVSYLAAKLFVDRAAVNERLRRILERHKGVEGVPIKHRINIQGLVNKDPEYLFMNVGEAVALDDVLGTNQDRYHIDEVEHDLARSHLHKVTIRLTAD